jgi:hypothetical protein
MLVTRVGDRVKAGDRRRRGLTSLYRLAHAHAFPASGRRRRRNWTELDPLCWAKFGHNESCAEDYKAVIRRAFI